MKIPRVLFLIFLSLVTYISPALATPLLYEMTFNINGNILKAGTNPILPDLIDDSLFNWDTGLGLISIIFSAETTQHLCIISFFDHDLNQATNIYFREHGTANNIPSQGETWEIDEPGYVYGDIYDKENSFRRSGWTR